MIPSTDKSLDSNNFHDSDCIQSVMTVTGCNHTHMLSVFTTLATLGRVDCRLAADGCMNSVVAE